MMSAKSLMTTAALLALTGTAQAALVSQGNGTVLDDATNLVWLADWNLNGQKSWGTQTAWAEALDFAGSQDWVLPTSQQFYPLTHYLPSLTGFTNVQSGYYWTSSHATQTDMRAVDSSDFSPNNYDPSRPLSAVAVRPWTQAAAVPEPQTLALALLALGASMLVRRRHDRKR